MKRSGVLFLFLLFVLAASSWISCETKTSSDRATTARESTIADSSQVATLLQVIKSQRKAGALDSAVYYSQKLYELGVAAKDTATMADAYYRKGFYSRAAGRPDSALASYYKARELFKVIADSSKAATMSLNMANILNTQGNYREAELIAVEGLEFLQNSPDNKFIPGLYNALAVSTKESGNYEDALSWYEKALRQDADSIDQINFENNKAVVLGKMDRQEEAMAILNRLSASAVLREEGNEQTLARVLDNLGYVSSQLELPGAAEYLKKAEAIRKEIDYKGGQVVSALHLAEHYATYDTDQANVYAQQAYKLAQELENPEDVLSSLRWLIQTEANPKNYALEYQRINDSILLSRQRSKDEFAKIRFESAENERKYMLAREEALLKSQELQTIKTRNLGLFVLLAFLIIGGIFTYRYLRLKSRKQQVEAIYSTEQRISKQVHDSLANDIFNIMNEAEHGNIEIASKERLLDSLESVYHKSRDISRDTGDIPVGKDFKGALTDLIGIYRSQTVKIITKGMESVNWEAMQAEKQVHLYRSLQELLVNMKKHSEATLVLLEFSRVNRYFHLNYRDNGKGIAEQTPVFSGGLKNTENRIEAIGGRVTFDSNRTQGFGINISFPN